MIFLDTSFLIALVNRHDDEHQRVRQAFEPYRNRRLADFVVTTNQILAETLTGLRRRGHPDPRVRHQLAMDTGRRLRDGFFGRYHRLTIEDDDAGFDYFDRHRDKRYSFVDCTSFALMDKLGITEAFAVDEDFTHHFTAIPGPDPNRAGKSQHAAL